MFTKTVPILTSEIWNALHSTSGDGIISTRKWTRVPTKGYGVDTEELRTDGFASIDTIKTWVEIHRIAVDFVPNAYVGACRSLRQGDAVYVVHTFASFPDAVEFAKKNDSDVYDLTDPNYSLWSGDAAL